MRIDFLGLPLDAFTMEQTIQRCLELVRDQGHHQHVVLNAAKVVAANTDPELAAAIRQCSLVNADGQSIVWAARALGKPVPERVAGIDLMVRLWELAATADLSVYLLGATESVIESVARKATEMGVPVVGHRNGYWSVNEERDVVSQVSRACPDLLFLAIPSPAKEIFLARHLTDLNARLVVGVGGSFDVIAGTTRRAPVWVQRIGMEWAFRLLQEPRRMFKRYLVGNSKFIALVASAKLAQLRQKRNQARS